MSETPIGALLEVYTTLRATVRPAWAGVSTGGPGQDWDLEIQRESDLESWGQRQAGDYLGSFVEMGFIYVFRNSDSEQQLCDVNIPGRQC